MARSRVAFERPSVERWKRNCPALSKMESVLAVVDWGIGGRVWWCWDAEASLIEMVDRVGTYRV